MSKKDEKLLLCCNRNSDRDYVTIVTRREIQTV